MTFSLPQKINARPFPSVLAAFRAVGVPFLVSRVLLFVLGAIARVKLPLCPLTAPLETVGLPLALRFWDRWDTGWYLQIVREGYSLYADRESNVAFFPLYPLLLRAGGYVFGQNRFGWLTSGLLISHAALLISLVLLYRLAFHELGSAAAARRTCLYLCVFPSTLFLGAVYPMSLGLALSLGCYTVALGQDPGRWRVVGLLGGLAVLSRAEGILLIVPLIGEFIAARSRMPEGAQGRPRPWDVLWLGLMPLALAGWCSYLYLRFGDPFAFRTTLKHWSYGLAATEAGHARAILDWAFLLFFIALLPLCWRRLRFSYALHATVYTLMLLALGVTRTVSFGSGMRYGLNLFPDFLVLSLLGRRASFHDAYMIVSVGLASLFMIAFALFYWVA